jgi:DNA-binding response OmpR family regulator
MSKKVLIIEDEIDIVSIYQVAIDDAEIELLIAPNGEEGFDITLKEKPDLIILDLLMPKMNGYQFLEKLRSETGSVKDTPVIVASNLGQSAEMDKIEKYGVKDYLMKDRFSANEIIEKVTKYLR